MKKLCRLGAIIPLFLLLANGFFADVPRASIRRQGWSGPDAPRTRANRTSSAELAPTWYGDRLSYSDYERDLPDGRLEPEVERLLAEAEDDDLVRVIVYLRPRDPVGQMSVGGEDGSLSGVEIVSRLKETAEGAQAGLRTYLDRELAAGRVSFYQALWITNAIVVEAWPTVIRELAADPSVDVVRVDHWRQWVDPEAGKSKLPGGEGQMAAHEAGAVAWNVSHVRADEVWRTLGISGTGSVVAGLDTGVDWLHPALQENYRGYRGASTTVHAYSWFDATPTEARYPVDGHGHGTHTLGTAVGQGGIGIAPGAQWIGVKVLNSEGAGYESWIHAGFQWVLAPGGDPSRAPDVVSCSWGNTNAGSTVFQEDLQALRAAGIIPVFASGNDGPGAGSVSSPASLPGALAVGAVDEHDEVASFSGRGPSPWGEIRPHVVAPGVHVRSSTPGGTYGEGDGTSMATPHVSGIAAMLRSVSPTLTVTSVTHVLTSTAVPLGEEVPNNDAGWGRVDALAAATAVARPGWITGTVRRAAGDGADDGRPVAGATVRAASRSGRRGAVETDAGGVYSLALAPGTYDLTVSAFGYESREIRGLRVVTGTTLRQDVSLTAVPTGTLDVFVVGAESGDPVRAQIDVLETPYQVMASAASFGLPVGTYTVRAGRLGYRVVTGTVAISAGATSELTLALPTGPSVLLVDSGGWYYESQIEYFREALDDLSYAYDVWSIEDIATDVPSASDLTAYDIVIWSAPRDAPGYVGAGAAVGAFLEAGGRLLLSGQDVGFWDGGGTGREWSPYYQDYLRVRLVTDNAPSRVLEGQPGDIFAGQRITIAGPGGADNQDYPDVVSVVDNDVVEPLLSYENDGLGGVRVGTCVDYRALYLAFGFEGINEAGARREIMGRSMEWLTTPAPRAGLELLPEETLGIGSPGSIVTHSVRLRHSGQAGDPDEVSLTLEGASWDTELNDHSLTLSPCASRTVTISVTVPPTIGRDVRDVVTLTAHSSLSPTVTVSASFETKTPAPLLLVDDDRWYDQQATYKAAMDGVGLRYDVWETHTARGHRSGPTSETLAAYPAIIWWTGYDWHAPVTEQEVTSLDAYLEQGGRLMLSSQDFLYYHHDDPFGRDRLGVLTYTEDITPTMVAGVRGNGVASGLGPWKLDFPDGYDNWSDGLVPGPGTGAAFRDEDSEGAAVALTRREKNEATLFFAFPFEALPRTEQAHTMERSVGWLSWLGRSDVRVEPRSASSGDTVTYTLTVRNDGPEPVTASLSNTMPADVDAGPVALVGPGAYAFDPAEERLSWQGELPAGGRATLTYQATVLDGGGAGEPIVNSARLRLEDHFIAFDREARLWIDAPDLSGSTFGCTPAQVRPGRTSTCTVVLRNEGVADAETVTAHVHPPGKVNSDAGSRSASGSLVASESPPASWGTIEETESGFVWSGHLAAGAEARLTFGVDGSSGAVRKTFYGVAFVDDGAGRVWERPAWLVVEPWTVNLPVVRKPE